MSKLPTINLYNTLTKSVDPLSPIEPGHVRMYCCGPTVYNYQHIGNLRTYIFEDLLTRTMRYAGYKVTHVMNITDVGHLVSDADEGEDKMLVAARREKKSSLEIAQYYTDIFFKHCDWLDIRRPDVVCKATEHIEDMISLVKRLEDNGYAYQSGGNVYFDVSKDDSYGKLARLDLEKLQAGARIDVDDQKRGPYDFALWFTNSKFDNQELQWDSPWGRGYPGWHIECSAMAMRYLGEHFDIHCGGIDHIPVHHTNEIAQSECASGETFADVWMHGGFLVTTDKSKMSKSTGEFLTLDLVKERGVDPMSYRLFCLSGTYRQELAFSWEALESADRTFKKIKDAALDWKEGSASEAATELSADGTEWLKNFENEIYQDLAFPRALALVHQLIGDKNLKKAEKLSLLSQADQVLGLGVDTWEREIVEIPESVMALAQARETARKEKNWQEADALRDKLQAQGFSVEDTASGPIVRPK